MLRVPRWYYNLIMGSAALDTGAIITVGLFAVGKVPVSIIPLIGLIGVLTRLLMSLPKVSVYTFAHRCISIRPVEDDAELGYPVALLSVIYFSFRKIIAIEPQVVRGRTSIKLTMSDGKHRNLPIYDEDVALALSWLKNAYAVPIPSATNRPAVSPR